MHGNTTLKDPQTEGTEISLREIYTYYAYMETYRVWLNDTISKIA
jgi:hypothetical protein